MEHSRTTTTSAMKMMTTTVKTDLYLRPVGFVFLAIFWSMATSYAFAHWMTLFYFNIFLHIFAAVVYLVNALIDALSGKKRILS